MFTKLLRKRKEEVIISEESPYNKYHKLSCLGMGAYAQVFLFGKGTDRIAVKQFLAKDRGERDEMCKIEAAGLKQVGFHPNVLRFYGAFYLIDIPCLALEYCELGALSSIYQKFSDYTVYHVQQVLLQTTAGLKHLLERNIVHRDVKEANILVKSYAPLHIVVADLNFAKRLEKKFRIGRGKHTTVMNTNLGTYMYKAPELSNKKLRNAKEKYGFKIDVYSLGVVMLRLLSYEEAMPSLDLPEELQEGLQRIRVLNKGKAFEEEKLEEINLEYYEILSKRGEVPLEPEKLWESVDKDAKALLVKMLLPLYNDRPSYDEILDSEWAKKVYAVGLPSMRSLVN